MNVFRQHNLAWNEWVDPANPPVRACVEAPAVRAGSPGWNHGHRSPVGASRWTWWVRDASTNWCASISLPLTWPSSTGSIFGTQADAPVDGCVVLHIGAAR